MVWELHHLGDGLGVAAGDAAHVQLAVALLLHLGDHPLERGAPADGQEHLGGHPVGDALQALLHESFSLQTGGKTPVGDGFTKEGETPGIMPWETSFGGQEATGSFTC